ncbi:uroporphyrinogen-III synthase [Herbaspirillum sp. alder98]|uniref:uroporphyrinogen-III synthase n=1 Tax=Herbaspirillum sp. alder98 TaxID=2913096 RepID=UPI001CD8CC49|nr:uroporphyrinogen-III synthase [Herbaspirillum sp. alder98]MCA1326012.1 uroporphyrinogen-III synthase [Herbaspirillum sp. alder98]
MLPRPDASPMLPVVVTRPQQQALAFARQVEALGREAVVFPLLCIEPLDDQAELRAAMARLHDYALVVFVSPNAVDAAFACLERWPAQVPIGIVGEGSRLALSAHGVDQANATIYAPLQPDKMDSEELLAALPLASLRGQRALIVRAQQGRDLLGSALQQHAIGVDFVTAYRRLAPSLTAERRSRLLALLDDGAEWVITSSEAMRHLLEMARLAGGADRVVKLQRQRIYVSHHRIARTAESLGFTSVILTGSGDERLLAALQSTS